MSDPIEKLNRLGDAMEGAPMPLPASEIRARGDRIRRRRHAAIAGASAAVVAAVAVPVVAFTVNGSDGEPDLTPSPTISDSVPLPSATLSEDNLLTSDDAIYPTGGAVDWVESDTYPADGQAAFSPCAQSSLADLGAETVLQRDFAFVVTDTQEVDPSNHLNEIVAEFPSGAEAEAAYAEITGWYDDCLPAGADTYNAGRFAPVPVGVDGRAEAQLSMYGPVDESLDPTGDLGYFLETGLVLSGDRVAVLSQSIIGQDYNFEVDDRPVVQMLPDAARTLALGNVGKVDATPTDVGTDWPTTIPADFPLDSGWPEDDGSDEIRFDPPSIDNQAMIPAGELQACGRFAVDPGAVDRLTTRFSDPVDFYTRELQLFPTDQEAVTYLAHLRALYEDCPTEGATPTTTTEVGPGALGDESLVITRVGEEIYRTVINVVRVGNAVAVDLTSDEGLAADIQTLATVTRENLADVVGAMYELQPAAPTETPDLTDPAAAPTIPAGFPLDAAVDEPPVEDGETTVEGPGADVEGVRAQTACGAALTMPNAGEPDPDHELGYSVSALDGYDGRTIRAYLTVQDALDEMARLRADLQGCDRDDDGDSLSDRLWRTFANDSGYDSVTFGYTYEVTENVGAPAGQLYTVVRVGNAVLAIEWGAEYGAAAMAANAPDQVELARMIAAEMCIFTVDGC